MRKYLTFAVGIAVIVGGVFVARLFGEKKGGPPKAQPEKAIPTVFVQTVQNKTQPIIIKSSGPIMAKNRVELFAEVQGVFKPTQKAFKPGVRYQAGETLLRMDASEQYANLQAQKSTLYSQITSMLADLKIDYSESYPNWQQYVDDFDLEGIVKPLPKPVSSQERSFIASKNVFTTYHNIRAQEIRQKKYTLKAPFSGILTETSITPGTLVRPGQRLGEFVSNSVYEMQVSVGVSLMPFMKVGKQVSVRNISGVDQTWTGKVIRINPKVDQTSQTFDLYLELRGGGLAEGLYLEAIIEARQEENAYELDRSLLIDESEVFSVQDSVLTKVEVNPIYYNDKTVVVRGLKNGMMLLSKSIPGVYEGMKVEPYQPSEK